MFLFPFLIVYGFLHVADQQCMGGWRDRLNVECQPATRVPVYYPESERWLERYQNNEAYRYKFVPGEREGAALRLLGARE